MTLLRQLPFVGREAEYETLAAKLDEARNNRGAIVLLAGEPGVGKTRLAEEFCEHASSSATVIRGNCYDGDVSAPFGPWTEALRSLIEQTPGADLRETVGPGAPDIAVVVPEIKRRIPDLEEAPGLDAKSERARLFESIGAFLRNAATRRPLVIVLDDMHWCDRPSLALLEQVARTSADRRMLILGAYRDAEIDRVHPLAQTLAQLRRMEHYERIAVRGFTPESIYDLLSAIEPSERAEPAKRALAAVFYAETEGNPFFIRELLNHLIETGKLAQQDGVWTGTVTSVEDLGIPDGIKEVIGRRLSRLSDGCNRMLSRASALSAGFSWDELKAISGVTTGDAGLGSSLAAPDATAEPQLLDLLDEAIASQLISERKDEHAGRYAFTHALIRQTLYEELNAPRRVLLHRQIGEALEQLYAANVEPHLPELARHFYQSASGGDVEKAIHYARRAGDRAVADIARRCGDATAFASAALGFASPFNVVGVVDPQAIAFLEEALDLLPPGDGAFRAMVTARLAHALLFADESERMRALGQEALDMVRRVGDKAALTYTLSRVVTFTTGQLINGHFLRRVSPSLQSFHDLLAEDGQLTNQIDEALSLAEDAGDKRAALLVPRFRVVISLMRGERDVVDAAIDLEERLAGEVRTPGLASMFRTMQARLDGRLDAVEVLVQRAFDAEARAALLFADESDPRGARQLLGAQMVDLRRAQGRLAEVESDLRRPDIRPRSMASYARAALALAYEQQDRREEAHAVFDEFAADDFALPDDTTRLASLEMLAEVCWYLGDRPQATILYERLLPLV